MHCGLDSAVGARIESHLVTLGAGSYVGECSIRSDDGDAVKHVMHADAREIAIEST